MSRKFVPRNRAERRARRRIVKTPEVHAWKRAFKGIFTPKDIIVIAGATHGA